MGYKTVDDVLDNAPRDLTSGQMLVLTVLANSARDTTRLAWPGREHLVHRCRMNDSSIRKALRALEARGIIYRQQAGTDKNGAPVYAHEGRAAVYGIATMTASDSAQVNTAAPQPAHEPREADTSTPDAPPAKPKLQRSAAPARPTVVACDPQPPVTRPAGTPKARLQGAKKREATLTDVVAAIGLAINVKGLTVGPSRLAAIDEAWARKVVDNYASRSKDIADPIRYAISCIRMEEDPQVYLPVPRNDTRTAA